jgi:hypothetical protein
MLIKNFINNEDKYNFYVFNLSIYRIQIKPYLIIKYLYKLLIVIYLI